jgi:hypothetical protein
MASLASRLWQRVRPAPAGAIAFRCNLCGSKARATLPELSRETPSCPRCGSTVRFRSIAELVVRELLGRDEALADLAPRRDLRGVGLSDADCYARPLARAFDYRNTYFHTIRASTSPMSTDRCTASTTSSSRATCSSTSCRRCRARSTARSRCSSPAASS